MVSLESQSQTHRSRHSRSGRSRRRSEPDRRRRMPSLDGRTFAKIDPGDRDARCAEVARSSADGRRARRGDGQGGAAGVGGADRRQARRHPAADRLLMREHRDAIAALVARETGKSKKDALGETDAAIEMGFFVAGEGRRFYGQTTTSAVPNKSAHGRAPAARRRRPDHRGQHADRQRGVEGVSGAAVRQRGDSEGRRGHAALGVGVRRARARGRRARRRLHDASRLRRRGRRAARRASRTSRSSASPARARSAAGLPRPRAGAWPRSASSSAARTRSSSATTRIWQNAVTWTLGSAFSNAGQRCAAGSRIIVFDARLRPVQDDARRGDAAS